MRNARSLVLAIVLFPATALVLHCGPATPAKTPSSASASANADARLPAPVLLSSALPSAMLPPPLSLTSTLARPDESPRCDTRAVTVKDPKATTEGLAKICAGSRRDATGLATQVASLDSIGAASTFDFQLKECAVVVASADAAVKSYVIVIEDDHGAPIVELPADAVTPAIASPVFCVPASRSTPMKVTLRVAVGAGAGKVAIGAELLHRDAKP